ncbi:hypothetical protein WOLCODRAFT_139198 [Wolfiporia cocos MD-104 SS10]|uniref:Carbohydrate-binding module family 19 domain-containing protein n=1 Tax=Wolfiporia cocos (strain MD-104) TaxID=742152 RepID=A0A2H3JT53_WOLCO|nr:hypothetical protein WOLCODRAFT_139198 [Wolfiporia cocos MD-104 SS10]
MSRMLATLAVLCAVWLANAFPTALLDDGALLRNGEEAQKLNTLFAELSVNGSCTSGQTACVNSLIARCIDETWKTETCPRTEQCFALPAFKKDGTFLSCTTPSVAAALIDATGASGGVSGPNGSSNTSITSSSSGGETTRAHHTSSSAATVSSSASAASGGIVVTRTITLTIPTAASIASTSISSASTNISSASQSVITLPPETTVLNASEASSVLANLTAGGQSSVAGTAAAPSVPFSVVTPTISSSASSASISLPTAGTTIILAAGGLNVAGSATQVVVSSTTMC